jgi:hypothetical protein
MTSSPNNEIKIRVSAQDDASQKIADVVQAEKALADQTARSAGVMRDATAATERREDAAFDLQGRIAELTAEQEKFLQSVRDGVKIDNQAIDAAERRARELRKLSTIESEASRATRQTADATKDATGSNTGLLASLSSLGGGFLPAITAAAALAKIYRQIGDELDRITRLQAIAAKGNYDQASADRELKLNMPTASDQEVGQTQAAAAQISQQAGVPQPMVTKALASALSSTGGNLEMAKGIVSLAAQVRPDQPGEIDAIAGAVGDVQNAIGSTDPMTAFGYLQTVAGQSRVVGNTAFKNIPSAVTGLMGFGFSEAEAGALFSAMSNRAADPTGEMTRTASIRLGQQLSDFFTAQGRPERGGAAIRALQADPALQAQFLEGASFEAAAAIPSREIVSGGVAATSFNSFAGQYGSRDDLRRTGERIIQRLGTGGPERVANIGRTMSTAAEAIATQDIGGATAGALRENLKALLQAAGQGDLGSQIDSMIFDAQGLPGNEAALDTAIGLLERRKAFLRAPRAALTAEDYANALPEEAPRTGQFGQIVPRVKDPTPRDAAAADRLDVVIEALKASRPQTVINIANQYNAGESRLTAPNGRLEGRIWGLD